MRSRVHVATLGFYANEMVEYVLIKKGVDKVILVYTEETKSRFNVLKEEPEENGIRELEHEPLGFSTQKSFQGTKQ